MAKENTGSALGRWITAHPWLTVLGSLIFLFISAAGMKELSFSSNTRDFFGKENPQLKALEALEDIYNKDDNVMLVVEPKNGNAFSPDSAKAIKELTDEFWQLPYSTRVDSTANYQHTHAEGDDLIVEDLIKNPDAPRTELQKAKEIAVNEPQLRNRVVSESGHVAAVSAMFRLPDNSARATGEIVDAFREKAEKVNKSFPDLVFHLTGGVMISNAFAEASEDDIKTLIPLMYLLMITVMWLTLRSVSATVATVLVIAFSGLTAMGLAGWLGIIITPPSATAPTIILTLAVADSIHILVTMLQEMRKGKAKKEAIVESLRVNMQPVFLTSITTAVGFLGMNFSDVPPFKDLGNIVAMGVMAAWFFSVTFLPAMVAILPVKVKVRGEDPHPLMDRFADFVVDHRRKLLYGMSAVVLILVAGMGRIDLNDYFLDYFDDRYAFRQATDFMEDNLTGMSYVAFNLETGQGGGISDPAYLRTLDGFSQWLYRQPEVVHVSGLHNVMKRLNMNMHGDDPEHYRIPEDRRMAAQFLLLYEMSLPFGLDLTNMINVDKSATKFSITVSDVYNRELREFEERAAGWLRENAPEIMHVRGSGLSMMFAHINERNIQSMLKGTFMALFVISGILIFALKDWRIGVLSIIPNVFPAAMAFGLWGLTVQKVGLAVSVVAAMSLGIVVDDTVHFLSKYLRARREHGMDSETAVRYSFHNVGVALVITSAILIAGFGVLALSGFKVNANMGMLTAIAISFALWVDFMLLPPMLMKLEEKKADA